MATAAKSNAFRHLENISFPCTVPIKDGGSFYKTPQLDAGSGKGQNSDKVQLLPGYLKKEQDEWLIKAAGSRISCKHSTLPTLRAHGASSPLTGAMCSQILNGSS
jgi:hypothetical protein